MKPGMETAYLNYIATDWKREQEELKKMAKAFLTRCYEPKVTARPIGT
jgi:hypothetical protein